MDRSSFVATCNEWTSQGIPFLFVIDYELENFHIYTSDEAASKGIYFAVPGNTNASELTTEIPEKYVFRLEPISFNRYNTAFSLVRKHIFHGNTFLLNLTFPTRLETDLTLKQIFIASKASYKLLYGDQFVVFSPESFVRIKGDRIYSYPMKGTIDASITDAEELLMENEKEKREHVTIVDLIRNDLSMVAKDVSVQRFRYIDRIRTNRNELLQVSSEISGKLGTKWKKELGEILVELLPAGSISGAPKSKTREIIREAEGKQRGYFTGIFGVFDGSGLDSGVMIRYIEKVDGKMKFRSGGGITGSSDVKKEYQEMIDKVYVPIV
ncbi:aminodeoxychorismate synthase component I [Bacteroidota bacterium]